MIIGQRKRNLFHWLYIIKPKEEVNNITCFIVWCTEEMEKFLPDLPHFTQPSGLWTLWTLQRASNRADVDRQTRGNVYKWPHTSDACCLKEMWNLNGYMMACCRSLKKSWAGGGWGVLLMEEIPKWVITCLCTEVSRHVWILYKT